MTTKRFSLKSLFCCFWDCAARGSCTTSPPLPALLSPGTEKNLFLQNFLKASVICNIEAKLKESATKISMLIFPNFLLMVLKYGVNYYLFEAIRTGYEIGTKNRDEDSVNSNCQLKFVFFSFGKPFQPRKFGPCHFNFNIVPVCM